MVVTLSRYSICSLKLLSLLVFWALELMDTRPFFAMISSLTRFIRTSSFSISTRTVLPTAGFTFFFSDFLAASFFGSFFTAVALACFAGFSFFFSSSWDVFSSDLSAPLSGSLNSPTIASLTSDTFSMAALIFSGLSFVKYTRLKFISNFSSSISCTSGTAFITSPSSSNALNTKNALAAFKRQDSSRYTVIPRILRFCSFAFSKVLIS